MISIFEYGTRVSLHSDLVYATGTVVGYDLCLGKYWVKVDGYEDHGTEMVPPAQLRPMEES